MVREPISLYSTVVACTEQVSAELADEVVILNLADGEYYGLNPVGAHIWSCIQEPRRVHDIRDELIREYDGVELEQCTQDVLALLDQLADVGLLEVLQEDRSEQGK